MEDSDHRIVTNAWTKRLLLIKRHVHKAIYSQESDQDLRSSYTRSLEHERGELFKTFIRNFLTLPNKIKAMSDYKLFWSWSVKDLLKEAFFAHKFVADYVI